MNIRIGFNNPKTQNIYKEVSEGIHDFEQENANLAAAFRIFLCLLVTTTSCGFFLSKLKVNKSYLCFPLGLERLGNMPLLCIEKETAV